MLKRINCVALAVILSGCAGWVPEAPPRSPGHLSNEVAPDVSSIPEIVERTPFLPPPEPIVQPDRYTVVVNQVPVRELLFALARDADVNIDIHPGIEGAVTLNAVEQSLPRILDRLSRQVDLVYEIDNDTITVRPDSPDYRTYRVDFMNMSRDTSTTVTVATQIQTAGSVDVTQGGASGGGMGGAGAGNNNSTTTIEARSEQRFWQRLVENISAILGEQGSVTTDAEVPQTDTVIPNPEAGLVTILATQAQHARIQEYIDAVVLNARRQVLIEATIVEVTLTDRYQTGIDWSSLDLGSGFDLQQSLLAGSLGTAPFFTLGYDDPDRTNIDVTVRALEEFGDVQVLSSPKMLVLNNHTSVLKVVDNIVYFEVDTEVAAGTAVTGPLQAFDTDARTVPVGLVMAVTPGIFADESVILNVRPTVTRVDSFVNDPNPALADAGTVNPVPVIETRELESMLRLQSGETAVLGGLIQDESNIDTDAVPFLGNLPGLGELFKNRDNQFTKTELVVFLRPTVITEPDINTELAEFLPYLESQVDLNLPPVGQESFEARQ